MKIVLLCFLFSLVSCSSEFLDGGTKMFEIKMLEDTKIELTFIGIDATARGGIWVSKQSGKGKRIIIDEISKGYDNKSKVQITKLNDTLIKLTLIDTTTNFPRIDSFQINLNRRILPNHGYSGAQSMGN
ncbi:MAG: hypothetical protein ABIU77_10210 [Ferruginibacter sp.]